MAYIHQASQVSPSLHSPALMQLVEFDISSSVIDYAIECVAETVDYAFGRPSTSQRGRTASKQNPSFTTFVTNVLTRAEVSMPTLLVALAYIDRVKPHLNISLEVWALERVFLGAVIVASKYLNDSTLKNIHWSLCSGSFGKRDCGRIEREFLDVLDWELGVKESDLLSHHDGLTTAVLHSRRYQSSSSSHCQRVPYSPKSATCPELRPSSPHSSISSASPSPRTPSSSSISPVHPEHSHPITKSAPAALPPPKPSSASYASSTMDLIRAFPIPASSTTQARSHQFHPNSSLSSHLPYPVRIVS